MAHGALGDHRTEKDFLERALKIIEQHFGPDHPQVAQTLNNLANAHGALGDHRTEKDFLERALKIIEQHFGPDHPQVAQTLNNLATAHGALGDHRTEKDFLERALKIIEQHFGPDHPEVALTLNILANAHGDLGRPSHSEVLAGASFEDISRALLVLTIHMSPLSSGILIVCHLNFEIHGMCLDAVVQFSGSLSNISTTKLTSPTQFLHQN